MDMSLDDFIAKKKIKASGGGGRTGGRGGAGRGRGSGPRRGGNAGGRGGSFRGRRGGPVPSGRWSHDMYQSGGRMPPPLMSMNSSSDSSTKMLISNLDYQVSDNDIRELFREFGDLREAHIIIDNNGCSTGSAQVVYAHHSSAMKAMQQYNGVHLDKRPMRITIEKHSFMSRQRPGGAIVKRLNQSSGGGNRSSGPQRGGGRGRGRGRGGKSSESKPKTAEELDAELDKYVSEAKTK